MFEKVAGLISEKMKVPREKVTKDARLVEDLGADSANVMMLIIDLEDEFDMTVEDSDILTLKTVGDVVAYIEAKS